MKQEPCRQGIPLYYTSTRICVSLSHQGYVLAGRQAPMKKLQSRDLGIFAEAVEPAPATGERKYKTGLILQGRLLFVNHHLQQVMVRVSVFKSPSGK